MANEKKQEPRPALDLAKLRRLALAASPGEWSAVIEIEKNSHTKDKYVTCAYVKSADDGRGYEPEIYGGSGTATYNPKHAEIWKNNAEFVGACYPAVILELLDRLEKAEETKKSS